IRASVSNVPIDAAELECVLAENEILSRRTGGRTCYAAANKLDKTAVRSIITAGDKDRATSDETSGFDAPVPVHLDRICNVNSYDDYSVGVNIEIGRDVPRALIYGGVSGKDNPCAIILYSFL
ncbi:unnamed protein product, partial [Oikopleura dioica]